MPSSQLLHVFGLDVVLAPKVVEKVQRDLLVGSGFVCAGFVVKVVAHTISKHCNLLMRSWISCTRLSNCSRTARSSACSDAISAATGLKSSGASNSISTLFDHGICGHHEWEKTELLPKSIPVDVHLFWTFISFSPKSVGEKYRNEPAVAVL